MRRVVNSFLLISFLVGAFACNSSVENTNSSDSTKELTEEERAKQTKSDLLSKIKENENLLKSAHSKILDASANQLVNYYTMYAKAYPKDSLAAEFYFRAADLSTGLQHYEAAIKYYNKVEKDYKDYIKHPESIYLAGFVYDTYMGKKGKAREYYEKIIAKYPAHVFAKDAQSAIKALHMTDEELVRMFEENNKKNN